MNGILKNTKIIVLFLLGAIIIFYVANFSKGLSYTFNAIGNYNFVKLKYSDAQKSYYNSLEYLENREAYHNLGNLHFLLGESKAQKQEKISAYKQALYNYGLSLNIEQSEKTQHNYDIVRGKLEELTQEEKQENKDQENEENDNGEDNNQEEKNDQLDSDEKQNNQSDSESFEQQELTQQQLKDIENYVKGLRDQQQQNQRHYNKNKSNQSPRDQFFEKFSNDPFFDSMFDRGGEKDW